MKNEQNAPKIRFKGFTDAWEQREVSDVAEITAGGTPSTSVKEYWNPKQVPWLSSGEVHKKYITYTDDKISEEGLNHSSARMIKENSVLIALAGQGKTRGTVAINRIPLSTNQSIAAMTFTSEICPEFIFSNLENRYDELRRISSGDGTRGGLNKQLVGDVIIPYTFLKEQQAIGKFFTNLDHLITLHQRKCETLQKLKKSMLQKMFPKNGSCFPEIRFAGFTDAWEQRKLKELASFAKGSGYSKTDIKAEGTPIILYGRLYTKYETTINDVDTFAEAKKGSIYSKGSEVIVPASGETAEDIARASFVSKPGILLGGDLNIIYPNSAIEPTFLALSISNGEQQKSLAKKAQGKSVVHLHNSDLETVQITYPTREEQRQIGAYFRTLDHLITLHQRKLETLKKLKKAMLQKMFI